MRPPTRLQRAVADVVRALGVAVAEEYDACGAEYSIDLAIPHARVAIEVRPVARAQKLHVRRLGPWLATEGFGTAVLCREMVSSGWLRADAHSRQEGNVLLCCMLDGCWPCSRGMKLVVDPHSFMRCAG